VEIAIVTAETMRPLLNTTFGLIGHDVELVLTEVDEKDTGNDKLEAFVLLFEGPTTPALAQGNWPLSRDDKRFDMFLVPIGPQPSGNPGYEAVFNRLHD